MANKASVPAVNVNEVSRISSGSYVKGDITSPNDIRIDGKFEGKIFSKGRVVIGETAEINGDIVGENVDLWGKINGTVYVHDTLALKDTCSVTGDLHIQRLVVELGAHFDGSCSMLKDGDFDKFAAKQNSEAVAADEPKAE